MTQKQAIQLFEERKVRTVWDDEAGKWYVSIVDVIAVLTESKDAAAYWRKLKQRLKAEGNETVTNCHGLKMTAPDGKMRLTDVADVEQLFRLVQSIPSPKGSRSSCGSLRLPANGWRRSTTRNKASTGCWNTTIAKAIPRTGSTSG